MMKIEEIWVWNDEAEGKEDSDIIEWIPMRVVTMVKYSITSKVPSSEVVQQESEFILCFHQETGVTAEVPFVEAKIKSIYDEKTKETISISAPTRKR